MDPIEVIELCRNVAYDSLGTPKDAFIPRVFNVGDYQRLWLNEPKKVRALLDELLCGPNVTEGLEMLLRFDVLVALFPELSAMKNLGDADGLHKDVWEHSKRVVAGVPNQLELRWGALLHDIGKVRTRRIVDGKVTFHNHDRVGARMVDGLHNRTKLFQDDVALLRTVRLLVLYHLRPASYKPSWTDSAVRRLVTECGDPRFFERLMTLSRADLTTKVPAKRDKARKRADELEARVRKVIEDASAPRLPKGTMGIIMSKVPIKPGKWLNDTRDTLESMMKAGLLPVDCNVDFYVAEGLKLIEQHFNG